MVRKQVRPTPAVTAGQVATVAAAAMLIHVVIAWFVGGEVPGAYGLGEILGTHLVAFLATALISSLTRLGSIGAMIAVYLLSFGVLQLLLVLTDLI